MERDGRIVPILAIRTEMKDGGMGWCAKGVVGDVSAHAALLEEIDATEPQDPANTRSGRSSKGETLAHQVWRLAWPAMAHMLLLTLVFLVGRAMVGRHSTTALAAMQICGTLTWAAYFIFSASSAGTLAVVARSIGARDKAGAAQAAWTSLGFAFLLGLVVMLPVVWANGTLLGFLFPRADPSVIEQADAYLKIVIPALPFAFVEASAAASLQGAGDTKTPLVVAGIGNVINIALSVLLIFGYLGFPNLGIRGAAIGTAATMLIEGVLLTLVLLSRTSPLPLRLATASHRDRLGALLRVLRVAGPTFFERIAYQGGYLVFVAMIGLLGAAAMAANQALVSIEAICFLSADGFGIAAAALVAQKLGAGRPDEARRAGWLATLMATLLLSMLGLVFALIPHALMLAFSSDPQIVSLGSQALYVTAIAQPFMAFATVMGMSLRGAGDTKTVLVAVFISAIVVRLATTWVFAITLGHGLVGVWIGSTADWICRSVLLGIAYFRGRWSTIAV